MKPCGEYKPYSKCSLFLTILIQLCFLGARSQSTLEISVPGNHYSVESFTFIRTNTISGIKTIDTFVSAGAGKYSIQLYSAGLPEVGMVQNNSGFLRPVFLVPGMPLKVLIKTNMSQQGELIAGPWATPDSAFRNINTETILNFKETYANSSPPERLKLFDRLLKTVDTTTGLELRSLKDFLFYTLIRQAIDSSEQLLTLNDHRTLYRSYMYQLAFGSFRNDIDRRYNHKLNRLTSAQQGNPAPLFRLMDSAGKMHRLEDYKGKLVYIDLWASWCLPCRLETPYMHNLMKKYSNRSDIAFIGVAVSDKLQDWKGALRQDKPRWLQLRDNNTFVANAYAATSVPRYVLIDKTGNVLDFNAPAPSEHLKLIPIIDKELGNTHAGNN